MKGLSHVEASVLYGDRLLTALAALPAGVPAVLFIRHAQRYPINSAATPDEVTLTPAGEVAARAFGERLPLTRRLRVYHSPIGRCRVTAERMAEGFTAAGGQTTFGGALAELCGSFVVDKPGMDTLTQQYGGLAGADFIRHWFDGRFNPAVIAPCHVTAENHRRLAEAVIADADPDTLTMLVTHDWDILTLRETFLKVRHEEVGWVDFLDGVAMARDGDGWQFRWREFNGRG